MTPITVDKPVTTASTPSRLLTAGTLAVLLAALPCALAAVAALLAGRSVHLGGDQALIAIAESWRPWRGVASRLFWAYYRNIRGGDAVPAA